MLIKCPDKHFKENYIFSVEKVVDSPQIIHKKGFHIGQVLITKYGLKTLSAIQHIGNGKQSRCLHLDQANPLLYTSVV